MYRSTTPTLIFNILNQDFDMDTIDVCHITIESESGRNELTLTTPEIDKENKRITVTLTQEQTLMFSVGYIKVQIKAKLKNGVVIPSKVIKARMEEILEETFL